MLSRAVDTPRAAPKAVNYSLHCQVSVRTDVQHTIIDNGRQTSGGVFGMASCGRAGDANSYAAAQEY